MQEIWKDVVGYEGLYQISNLGNVKSFKNGILKLVKHHSGYLTVNLCKNKTIKKYFVHLLVAEAFLNKNIFKFHSTESLVNINLNKLQINHKNENKTDNSVLNLEYCTPKYNANYGRRTAKTKTKLSKKINQYSLDENFIKQWNSLTEVSKVLNINKSSICSCCKNNYKKAGGYIWRYADK